MDIRWIKSLQTHFRDGLLDHFLEDVVLFFCEHVNLQSVTNDFNCTFTMKHVRPGEERFVCLKKNGKNYNFWRETIFSNE